MLELNLEGSAPRKATAAEIDFQSGLLASLATIVLAMVLRYGFGAPLVPEVASQFLFARLPISFIEFGVGLLGPFAKQLAFIGCIAVYGAGLLLLALPILGQIRRGVAVALSLCITSWLLVLLLVLPVLGAGLFGRDLKTTVAANCLWMLFLSAGYGVAAALLKEFFRQASLERTSDQRWPITRKLAGTVIERRRIASWVGYAIIGVAVYDIARSLLPSLFNFGAGRVHHGNGIFPALNGLAVEVTRTRDFYEVSKNASDPDVDGARWTLQIGGLVTSPCTFTLAQIHSLRGVEQYATLECISNEVGGDLIGNALWRGIRLKDLFQIAQPKPGVMRVVFRAADGYTDSIPMDRAMADGTMLAYDMNGSPLNMTHGFPLRLVVPGIYGMKNVKWITGIELVDHDFKGYWQARGWDNVAEYKTMSRIDVADKDARGSPIIAGIAFAGDRGISKVEVSRDAGKTWEEAEVKPALSPFSWVLWHKEYSWQDWRKGWMPESSGPQIVTVRATDGRGVTQTSQHAPPIPDGSSGYDARKPHL